MGIDYDGFYQIYYPPGVILIKSNSYQNAYVRGGQLSIRLKKYDYFPGDTIEGNIYLKNQNSLILNDIYLHIIISLSWTVDDDTLDSESSNQITSSIYVGVPNILKIKSNILNLNPGLYDFPFKIKIKETLPPCFEFPQNGKSAFLRYILKAQIASQYARGECDHGIFIKSRPRICQSPLSYSITSNIKKMGMVNQGSTILKVSYQTTSYLIRGQIPIQVEIDNTQGKSRVKSVTAKIIRSVQLKKIKEEGIRYNFEKIIMSKEFTVNVQPNTKSQIYNFIIGITDDTLNTFNYYGISNPYPKLGDLFYVMPTVNSDSIICNYFMIVSLDYASFVTDKYLPKVTLPFTLNHQSISDYEKEKKEELLKKTDTPDDINIVDLNDAPKIEINDVREQLFDKPIHNSEVNEINNDKKEEENNINSDAKNEILIENKNGESNNINNKIIEENNIININNENNEENHNIKNENIENNIINKDINSINNINNIKEEYNFQNKPNEENDNNKIPKNFSINDIEDEEEDNKINKNVDKKKDEDNFSLFS